MKIEAVAEAVVRKVLDYIERKYHIRLPEGSHGDVVKAATNPQALNDILTAKQERNES